MSINKIINCINNVNNLADSYLSKTVIQKLIIIVLLFSVIYCSYAVVNLIVIAQMSGDDLSFFNNQIISLSFIQERYQTWTSRFIVDTAAVFFCQHVILFKIVFILLILMVFCIKFSIAKDVNHNYKLQLFLQILFCALLTTVYPFYALHSAGFVDTSVIFAFPFIMMFLSSYILFNNDKYHINGRIVSSVCWLLLFVLSSVIACNNEMSMLFLFVCSIYKIRNTKGKVLFIIALISLLYTIFCPGNFARVIANMEYYLPEYAHFTIYDKLYIGITKTLFQILYINKIPFIVLLSLLVFLRTRSFVLFAISFFILKRISRYFAHQLDAANINEHNWIANFPVSVLIIMFALCIFALVLILTLDLTKKDKFESVSLIVLGFGIASSIGFSPSVFASNDRPGYIAQVLIIFCTFNVVRLSVFSKLNKDSANNVNNNIIVIKTLLLLAFLSVYNICINY